jgi:hypothetical protein
LKGSLNSQRQVEVNDETPGSELAELAHASAELNPVSSKFNGSIVSKLLPLS